MKKFSIMMVSLVAMASLAFAQQKAPGAGSGSAAPAAKAPAAGAGSAAKAPAAGSAATMPAPAPMAAPKPPTEIKDAIKAMGTRQNCTGVSWGGPDGKTEMKTKMAGTHALALDGFWIKGGATITMGEGKAKMTLKMDSYMTWDAKAGTWRTVGMMNDGSLSVGTATMTAGKFSSQSDTFGGMMGNGKFRETGDMTDPKNTKMSGEMSMDGKTWTKVYDMTCKK